MRLIPRLVVPGPAATRDPIRRGDVGGTQRPRFRHRRDPALRKSRAARRRAFAALDLFLAPGPRARYRIQFRSNPQLLRFHDAALHWRRWVTEDPVAPALVRAEAAALANQRTADFLNRYLA